MNTGRRPEIVGRGWGFFIGRRSARDPVFTHYLVGRPDEDRPLLFLCGTTIKEASETILEEFNKTFWSTPTMQNISLGSWLSRSCHGNSGPAGHSSSFAAETVYAIHIKTAETAAVGVQVLLYSDARVLFDANQGHWFLVAVEFALDRLADNIILQKRLVEVTMNRSVSDGLREWLSDDAVLRVLFFGTARRLGLGVVYTRLVSMDTIVTRDVCGCCGKTRHVDPHCASAACISLQLDTCSLLCGWYEKTKNAWRGIITLKNANAFSPSNLLDHLPSVPLVVLWTGLLNFEFMCTMRKAQWREAHSGTKRTVVVQRNFAALQWAPKDVGTVRELRWWGEHCLSSSKPWDMTTPSSWMPSCGSSSPAGQPRKSFARVAR